MKYVGAHVSAEGGVDKAPGNAASIGARAFALFTRNQRQWQAKRLSAEEVTAFRTNCREAGYSPAQILKGKPEQVQMHSAIVQPGQKAARG